ncbi:dihydroorotase [Sphingobacterium psychroaquaticum]|uniref:Dihydroorotase n=1 Tax=Sphingobacterium psychroaquaticum TaxID=561061 RepID=A0A1X7IGG1_9SPHI|nr:dihydroorotase [Sphingobacterium psychroaquaticum]QBQ41608.1 dihydroorotase [Sphingobacterium psychroaquaticum]SMG13294.1 dihydroorotase [Sphingobacterium psychroaquaticum]
MSDILISAAKLVLPGHQHDGQIVDMLIENGSIREIAKSITPKGKDVQVVDAKNAVVSAGFFDLNSNFGEPGLETKEDISTGTRAAAAGGFTEVAIHPNTNPALQSRSEVALVVNAAKGNLVNVYPVGSVSKKREGKELAELYDMKTVGAVAFCDGNHSVQQAGLMGRALLYAKGFDGLIISFAEDESIAGGNQMNEGVMSTYLGMKGKPNLAESLMVSRDLFLAEYNEAPIHFTTISTTESLELIKKAKAKGIQVTCDVAAHNLVFTDDEVVTFDSNYKVNPPLRTKKDVKALLKGLRDGTIDAVVSQHTPQEIEFKDVEFHIAKDGIIGFQTVLPFLLRAGLTDEEIVSKLVIGPRAVLKREVPTLTVGEPANLVVFSTTEKWVFNAASNKSKSANSPVMGQELTGKVLAVVNNNQLIENK